MLIKIAGFILSEVPYGESSKIINVLTEEYGLIGIMAKGAKSIKSKNRVATLKYSYSEFLIYYKKDKLSLLKSADIINPLKNIKSDIILISYVTYLAELANQVMKQSNGDNIYNDFIKGILKIEEGLDPLVITNILEVKFLDCLGVGFNIDSCVKCGTQKKIITISPDAGGFICEDCLTNEYLVPINVIKLIRMYYYVDIKSITKLNIVKEEKQIINKFLDNYYEKYTGIYLNSKKFLKNILGY